MRTLGFVFFAGCFVANLNLFAQVKTGVEEIDAARLSVKSAPTNDQNAQHRQSVLFSWFRHMINRGVDLQSMDELGFTLAHWGVVKPKNYHLLDEAYALMENLQGNPVYIEEIRGPGAAPDKDVTDWPFFGGSPQQAGLSKDTGPMTGEVAWKFPTGHSYYAPAAVENGRVYITSPGIRSLMYCLDEVTGDVIWKTEQDGLQMYATPRGASNVEILKDQVVMRATSGSWEYEEPVKHIFYIDKKTGEIRNQIDANRVDYRRGATSVTATEEVVAYPYGRVDLKNKPGTTIMQDTVRVKNRNGRGGWALRTGQLFGEIVIDDDLVFAGTDCGFLYALNLRGGNRMKWKYEAGSPIRTTPAVDKNIVVTTTESGCLIGLDRSSGKERWRTQLNSGEARAFQLFSAPAISDGKIFIGSATKELYCADLESGKLLWRVAASDWIRSKPLVIKNRVYFASLDGTVTALEFNDSGTKQLWSEQAGHHEIFSDLSGTESGILVSTSELYLYSLNPENGAVQWRHSVVESTYEDGERRMADIVAGGGDFQSPPTVSNGKVYVGTPSRFVFAVDAQTGKKIWRFETSGQVSGAPSVYRGRVYFGQQGGNEEMYCVDAETGDPVWSSKVGWVWCTSTPDDERVYTGTVDGRIIALDVETGEEVWEYLTNGGVYPAPAVDDKRVYTGAWDGHYFALDKKTGLLDWAYSSFRGAPDSAAGVLWKGMYICRSSGELCALDANTGEMYWSFKDPRSGPGRMTVMNATPSNSGDYTFVSATIDHDGAALGGTLYCLDTATGKELWHYKGAGGWTGSSCTEKTVLCGSSTESFVTCLDVEPNPDGTPKIIWRTKIGGILEETIPAISGNRAYLLCSDGYLYAFD
ncbi:Serine/threonine-protein kinase AfsK [Pontiella desulfatans]|uniref:Serine/threonine-protein kinase AfsK n=1 Tax=Pontiella desulfatans TaxID=2750659 RepID=A0A6C2U1U5_PONDE|nr:Serine/threonine-protein kinase AfsK [Pontiella desulfatans]